MALPKVTPGTYNYGEYANPTPIRYNASGQAALGAGIASAITSVAGAAIQKKQEAKLKEKQNKALVDKVIADTYSRASKEAREQNPEQVLRFANQAGQLELDYRNQLIDRETYIKNTAAIQDGLTNLVGLQQLENQINLENIDPSIIKNKQGLDNYLLQKSLENNSAKRIWNETENEWYIEYQAIDPSKIDTSKITELNGLPDEAYQSKRIAVSEIMANPKNFFKIDTKVQLADEPMQNLFTALANNFNKNQGRIYMTNVSENGYELLDEGKAVEGFRNSSDVDVVYTKFGKDIAEDILDLEYNPEDAEQVDQIKTFIAQQAIAKADKTGNKVPKPREQRAVDPIEERTGMDLRDRAVAFDQINSLKPGERMEIKYKGSNDFKKENYIIERSSEGDLVFKKDEEGAMPSVISQQDLIKEFGVGSLINLQEGQQENQGLPIF